MKKYQFYLLLSFVALAYMGCEKESASDVNQDKIYADYELFYDRNTDKSWAIARFRFGGVTGTPLELDSIDFVTFNGDTLAYNPWFLGHQKEYAGRLTNGTFSYTNLDGETFVNTTPAYDSIAFPVGFDTITKSVANTLTWSGSALGTNETVGLFVGSWTWGQDAAYVQTLQGATDLVMGTVGLANLPVGPAVCHMDRASELPFVQGTTEGGRIRAKYKALNRTVQVVQ